MSASLFGLLNVGVEVWQEVLFHNLENSSFNLFVNVV